MPRRRTATKATTRQALKNASYETRVVSWLMQDGWQIFTPVLDHTHKTDILISDGPNFFRIQVKTVEVSNENHVVENRWQNSEIDIVIFFARNSNWGYIAPAFKETKRKINHVEHIKFQKNKNSFLKSFHSIDC